MKILICPDSFKGTLSSVKVCEIIAGVYQKAGFEVTSVPIADGGDGTLDSLLFSLKGEKREIVVFNPFGRKINAYYAIIDDMAVIEMAQACGIIHLKEKELNPWIATSYGFGQLINDALNAGIEKLILTIGGTSTNDAGIGMLPALGVNFFDKNGNKINKSECLLSAADLESIDRIDISELKKKIGRKEIIVFTDVKNPLLGKNGATFTYGFQKGADNELAEKLEKSIKHFSEIIKRDFHSDTDFEGAGAAGGAGAALHIFLSAKIKSGIDGIIDLLKLESKIKDTDIVIVGEGKMDSQSLYGKAPVGIAKIAKKYNKKVIAIVGIFNKNISHDIFEYIDLLFSCYNFDKQINFEEIKNNSETNLKEISKLSVDKLIDYDKNFNKIFILNET
jgi:glycerate kinase